MRNTGVFLWRISARSARDGKGEEDMLNVANCLGGGEERKSTDAILREALRRAQFDINGRNDSVDTLALTSQQESKVSRVEKANVDDAFTVVVLRATIGKSRFCRQITCLQSCLTRKSLASLKH